MVSFEIFLLFVFESVDGVVDSEDVLGVEGLLHVLHEIDGHGGQDALHESLSDLADAVVMREGSTLLHALVTALVLDVLIHLHNLVLRDVGVCVVVAEVDVDGSSSFVDLSDAEGCEETVFLDAAVLACLDQSLADLLAQGAHLAPRARCLK